MSVLWTVPQAAWTNAIHNNTRAEYCPDPGHECPISGRNFLDANEPNDNEPPTIELVRNNVLLDSRQCWETDQLDRHVRVEQSRNGRTHPRHPKINSDEPGTRLPTKTHGQTIEGQNISDGTWFSPDTGRPTAVWLQALSPRARHWWLNLSDEEATPYHTWLPSLEEAERESARSQSLVPRAPPLGWRGRWPPRIE